MDIVGSWSTAEPAKSGEEKPDPDPELPLSEKGERRQEVDNSSRDKERFERREDMSMRGANPVTPKTSATNHDRIPTALKKVPTTLKKALATVSQNQTSTGSKASTAKRLQVEVVSGKKQWQDIQRRHIGRMVEKEQRKDIANKVKTNKRKATSASADGDDDEAQTDICVVCDAEKTTRASHFLRMLSKRGKKVEVVVEVVNSDDSVIDVFKEEPTRTNHQESVDKDVIESQQSAANGEARTGACAAGKAPEKKTRVRYFLKRRSKQGQVNDETQTGDAPEELSLAESFLNILSGQEQTAVVEKSQEGRKSNNGMKKAIWHKKKRKTKENETWSEALETLRVGVVDVLNPKGMVDDVMEEWVCFWE